MQELQATWVQSLGWEDPLEKGKANHSSILSWRIPSPWGPREGGERKTGVPAAAVRGEGEPRAARAPVATTRPGRRTLG